MTTTQPQIMNESTDTQTDPENQPRSEATHNPTDHGTANIWDPVDSGADHVIYADGRPER